MGLLVGPEDQAGTQDGPNPSNNAAYAGDPCKVGHEEVEKLEQATRAQVNQD